MTYDNENTEKSMSMAEKANAIIHGERRIDDYEIPGYYERIHKIGRLPGSHFIELNKKGWKAKLIAQAYGLSEFKVRKILKDPDITSTYVVYENEDLPLLASRIREAKKIVDSSGLEVNVADIIYLLR
ncbi:MAG: hypothetical protein ACYC1A_02350 [Spirochaetales bacterium]